MFQNKVHDQKVELLRAVFRNMYLKEKCDYLDGECKMLAEHILSSQVTRADKNETKVTVEKELNDLRHLNDQLLNKLSRAKEQIMALTLVLENSKTSVLSSVTEYKSMNEDLELKNDMIKCLQEELVHVRLEVAEKWAVIRELRQTKDELEKDKEMLTKTKPETISRLQQELIEAKLLETQYSLEFNNIRTLLDKMKTEINTYIADDEKNGKRRPEPNVKLTKKGALWQTNKKNNVQTVEIIEEIEKLQKEKSYLQSKIPGLKSKLEILNKHLQFKEAERRRLQEKLDDVKLRFQGREIITLERKRQYDYLENSASEKVCGIRNSSQEKKQNIDELSSKLLDKASERRESYGTSIRIKEASTVQALEEKIGILEDKISQLKSETIKLPPRIYSEINTENTTVCDNMS